MNEFVYDSPPSCSGFSPATTSPHTGEKVSVVHSDIGQYSSEEHLSPSRDKLRYSRTSSGSSSGSGASSPEHATLKRSVSPLSDTLSGLTQNNPIPPVPADSAMASVVSSPVIVKPSNPDEEEEVWIPGASTSFVNLVKRVNDIRNNPTDDSIEQFPSLLCDDGAKKPSVHRLPTSPYIHARKEYLRQTLLYDSRAEPATNLFPKPPPTLERVAEIGDKLEQKSLQDGSGMKLGVLRSVPIPHELWHDSLHDKYARSKRRGTATKTTEKTHASKIKFLPKQAKSIELSTIWSLKATNYIDNFLFLSKKISTDQSEMSVLLQDWAKTANPPPDVVAGFASLTKQFDEQKCCVSEIKDLFLYVINNLVYLNTMVELSRRDDLQSHMSYLVSARTTRLCVIRHLILSYVFLRIPVTRQEKSI